VRTLDDGNTVTVYPYASEVKEMKPLSKVDPSAAMSEERKLCDRAFALACRYSGGRDLIEEMVASVFLLLGRRNEDFKIEMVQVLVFGPAKGLPFPRFKRELGEGKTKESFWADVEICSRRIVGKMSEREYVARWTTRGTMPRFNRVFEEYVIHHEEYEVPAEVFAALEKKKEAATRNMTIAAEAKKRKGGGAAKALAKKPRVGVLAEVSAGSSSGSGSSSAGSG